MYYLKTKFSHKGIVWKMFVIIFLTASGCQSKKTTGTLFYPVDSVLQNQIKYLAQGHASLRKVAIIGNEETSIVYTPGDTSAWKKELEIFNHINVINKPVNRGEYAMSEGKEISSGYRVKTFTTTENLPVRFLKVYYDRKPAVLRKLEAEVKDENLMYGGARYLKMEFQGTGNESFLSEYSVKGGQKMFMGDSVEYNITGSISIPGI
jgi:hypothetical protein